MKEYHSRRLDFDSAVMSSATRSTVAANYLVIRLLFVSQNAEKGTEKSLCALAPCGSDNS